jgi:hypothetical protein
VAVQRPSGVVMVTAILDMSPKLPAAPEQEHGYRAERKLQERSDRAMIVRWISDAPS